MTGDEDVAAQISDVEGRLRETRLRRLEVQRQAAGLRTAEMALERARRDRSTRTSPAIDELVERIRHLHDELADDWGEIDHIAALTSRMKVAAPDLDFTGLDSQLALAERARETAYVAIERREHS